MYIYRALKVNSRKVTTTSTPPSDNPLVLHSVTFLPTIRTVYSCRIFFVHPSRHCLTLSPYNYIFLRYYSPFLYYQMRDIRHDNINPFIGACIDTGNIMIVTQYGVRGSLQVSVRLG